MSTLTDNLNEVLWPEIPFPFFRHAILIGRRGSEAHGTYVPPADPHGVDDRDLMGVMAPPVEYYCGLKQWEGKEQIREQWDVVLYEVRKFLTLCANQNPGVLQMLWLEEEDYLLITPEGRAILEARDLFRDRNRAYRAFLGYANKQLGLMTRGQPYAGYMGQKRRTLVDKFGFDSKAAAHCIRLLRTGYDYLKTGIFKVRRTDDVELILEVKRGMHSLRDVQDLIRSHIERFQNAYDWSVLPDSVDMTKINELATAIVWSRLHP